MFHFARNYLTTALFFLFPLFAFTQVGPMGIGNADGSPTSAGPQPRLLLWLDGSSASPYTNGGNLDVWNDKSGNGHNFTPGSSNRPSLAISITGNGPANTPGLRFFTTPIGRRLICPDFELTEDGYTIFYVARTEDDNFGLFSYSTPTSEREMLIYNDTGIRQQMTNTLDRASAIGDVGDNTWNYSGITWSSDDDNNWEYSGGAAYEGGFNTFDGISLSANGSAIIGDIEDAGGGFAASPRPNSFEGFIAEIFIFEGRLSRPATRLLTTYLWVKYGLAGSTPAADWDKFYGNYSASLAGEYYSPIGIGNDDAAPNGGSINEARSEGLVLRVNEGEWTQGTSYLCAAPLSSSPTGVPANSVTSSNLTGTSPAVLQRWLRTWEIAGNSEGNSQEYQIAFDFGEGIIGGQIPQNAENFVLLYRDGTTGNFSVLPVPNNKKSVVEDELVFRVPKSSLITPGRFYTIGTVDASSSLTGSIKRTWYAYKSGAWSDTLTWTLDGSASPAYVNPDGAIPDIYDNVFIGSGRNVNVNTTLPILGDLTVFGTLDFASTAQATFDNINGAGLIRCAAGNFPAGNSTAFADPVFGGTLEFYGAGGFTQTTKLKVNKLKINLNTAAATMTFAADSLITNGLFEINKGSLIVNNSASTDRILVSNDRVLVESQGRILVSTASGTRRHRWYFYNDLINNGGQIKFTNRTTVEDNTYFASENQHIIVAYFSSGSANQELRANGLSYFSRIVIDKGIDMSYILSISSTNANFFKLLGRCNYAMSPASFTAESDNQNSLALINGTVEIRENIFIPLQTNNVKTVFNGSGPGSPIYNINNTAQLWVNGGTVTKGPLGGTGSASAIVPYGKVRVSKGTLNALCNRGITLRENGLIQVDGGVVNANNISTSFLGDDQIGGVIINGGVINVDGTLPGGIGNNNYATFCLSYPGNLFRMTGGVLNITGPANTGLVYINSDPQNTSVSGGTVNLDISNTSNNYKIASRAAFWNLNLTRSISSGSNHFYVAGGTVGTGEAEATMDDQDLIVRNNLSISGPNSPTLNMAGNPIANLYVHGNLQIGVGCVYNHNNNTTYFVGSSNSSLTFGGSTAVPFFNIEVNKDLDSRFVTIQQTGPQPSMNILGNLNLEKGYFVNKNRHVDLRGNIINRSQFGDETSTGFLRMSGNSGRQEIFSDGGVFHWLRIANIDGAELKNDGITVKTRLTLDSSSFYIGDHKLRMETTNSIPIQFANSTNKFIVCSGNASAGGLEILNHTDGQSLNFPIGVSTGLGLKWTPVDIYINSDWADDGFIAVTPVDTLLSTADLSGSADYLNFYWRVSSTDYDTKPNVTHRFKYAEDDIRGTEANFEPGRVLSDLPFTRSIDDAPASSHINTGSNLIHYNGSDEAQATTVGLGTPLVDANYTAGNADRFPAGSSPDIFFSRSATLGATWATPGNWNKLSECTGCTDTYDYHSTSSPASTTDFPQTGDIAVIGFDVSDPLFRPHVYKAPVGGIEAAQIVFTPLQDATGNLQPRYDGPVLADLGILRPTLEISNTIDIIKVGQITGEGALMLKGNVDLGVTDIGGFLSEDSSIVVVNNGVLTPIDMNFLPAVMPNLFLARTAPVITSDIRVRGNLEVAGDSRLTLSETNQGNIEIDGDLILDKYQRPTGAPRVLFNKRGSLKTIRVHGDVKLLGNTAHIGINPAAGGPSTEEPWTPEGIGAFLWFDAQDATTITPSTLGSSVSAWNNKASGSYNATQASAANQPVYQAAGLNGHPTLRFDGSDFLSIPHNNALNINANQDFEIFSVVKQGPPGDRRAIFAKGQTSPGDFLLYQDVTKYRLYVDANALSLIAPVNIETFANMGWGRRQGNSAFMFNTIGGNQSSSGVAAASTTGNTHNVTIGATENGTTRFLNGDIAEIILIKRALTDEERKRMEGYLAHKWGLEEDLPSSHPYKTNPPTTGGNDGQPAQLIVDGNILQNLTSSSLSNNGVELYKLSPEEASVNLILSNSGNHEFDNQGGPTPRLWKLTLDKGINTTSSFAFNTDVEIAGPADEAEKPINIQNGLIKFNNPNIDITLSSGGGDFEIPNTGGLELNDGDLQITGNETGLILAGSLNITGGSFNIGDTEGQNNYIEYSATGVPKINITGGSLTVGSQIRRNLSSTGGALNYEQSGGQVIIGRYSSPESNRGMLEVLNPGSNFEHTGGTLTFVRGVNLGTTPSLLLTPATHNVGETSEIIIGNLNSPDDAAIKNFGIQSIIPLNNLTINSTNAPVVNLITNNLELNGDLTIEAGATLNCANRNLLLNQNVTNDGLLRSTAGLVNLIHPVSGTVGGSGEYDLYNLERSGGSSGITQVQTDLLVKNNFTNDEGEMDFEGNTLTVEGNVTTDGTLSFDASSNGLILSGSAEQVLTRTSSGTSEIDVLTIYNNLGVTIPAGFFEFVINKNLRLEKGVFNLTGNLLEMASGSVFTAVNPFNEANMIVTGGAFANFGIKLHIPANTSDDIFVPLGIDRYMPINLDFSSSGTTASTYILRLNTGENGVVIQDTEDPGPQINDLNNVLGMYFSVDGTNIGDNLNVDLKFRYHQQYVQATSPYTEANYIAARVFADNTTIGKYGTGAVDEVNNIITYNIQGDFAGDEFAVDGDYFAGVDGAIPSTILVYVTDPTSGNFVQVTNGSTGYDQPVPGGGAPAGALVIVDAGDILNFNEDGINFYRTEIEEGSLLIIPATSLHRLGKVTGLGTILLTSTGNLPAGDYTEFFGCPGGKLIYQSNTGDNFEVLSNMPPIDQVTLYGPGDIAIADNEVNICNNLILQFGPKVRAANSSTLNIGGNLDVQSGEFNFRQGTTVIQGDLITSGTPTGGGKIVSGNNGIVTVEGDLIIGGRGMSLGTVFRETHVHGNIEKTSGPTAGSIQDGTGGAKLVLNGIFPQTITGDSITGDFVGNSKIPFIELNNGTGLTLNGDVEVSDTLKLTDGNIFTSTANMLRLTEDGTDVDPAGGRPNSFVNGPMQWALSNTAAERIFPVGKNEYFRPLSISDRSTVRTWEVEYNDTIARVVPTIDPLMLPDPDNIPAIETVSKQEYWRVETNASPALANIRLSWGDNSVVSTNTSDQSKLLVLAYNDATDVWDSYGGDDFQYDAPTNRGSVKSIDQISFSERYFTLGSSDGLVNPLPVTWLYFDGENKEKDNILYWATASEQNNDYFELERSLDASNWNVIAQITAAGQSYTEQTYSYTDRNAPYGRVYYRLKQVDFDGAMDYAPNIVSIERGFAKESESFDFLLFPNPTQLGTVRFRMSTTADALANVSISDLSGKLLAQSYIQIDGQGTSAPVDCNFEPGIYLVTVIVKDKMRSKPLVITK